MSAFQGRGKQNANIGQEKRGERENTGAKHAVIMIVRYTPMESDGDSVACGVVWCGYRTVLARSSLGDVV